jgi:ribosome maturation factor RimP
MVHMLMIISTLRVGPRGSALFVLGWRAECVREGIFLEMAAFEGGAHDRRFMRETGVAAAIASLVEPVLEHLGFRLVRVRIAGRDGQTVQIMVDRPAGSVSVDDCEAISRTLSPLLDAHDPMPGSYRLEISSSGIDRPLVRPSDFVTWVGHEARIELNEPVNARKRYRGVLAGFENGEVRIACDLDQLGRQVLGFSTDLIAEARLVLTDALIRDALGRAKEVQKKAASDLAGRVTIRGGEHGCSGC